MSSKGKEHDVVVKMAYYSTQMSADKNSLDPLRSMVGKETPVGAGTAPFFETALVFGFNIYSSPAMVQLNTSKAHEVVVFTYGAGDRLLFGWHFELWGHRLSALATGLWRQRAAGCSCCGAASAPLAAGAVGGAGSDALWPAHLQATGTGVQGVADAGAVVLETKHSQLCEH